MRDKSSTDSQVHKEIQDALQIDQQTIGDVFRKLQEYPNDYNKIAKEMGWRRVSPVYSYRSYIRALQGKFTTDGSTLATQIARQSKSFLNRHKKKLSSPTIEYLGHLIKKFSRVAEKEENITEDIRRSEDKTRDLLSSSGIYAVSSWEKMSNPEASNENDPVQNRYLVKVGRAKNVDLRIKGLLAGMTENPRILLIITSTGSQSEKDLEKKFHSHLKAIGHGRPADAGGGKEWYITNTETLRSIADLLELEIRYDFETLEFEN